MGMTVAGGSIRSGGERRLFSEIPRQRQQLDRNGVRLRRRRDLVDFSTRNGMRSATLTFRNRD